jgi:hypothetical protein
VLGAETLNLVQFDVSVHRLSHGGAGDPPVSAGQPGRHIGPGPGLSVLDAAGMRDHFAMRRLPQPHEASLFAEDDSVVPPPDHHVGPIRRGGRGYEVTWYDALCPG